MTPMTDAEVQTQVFSLAGWHKIDEGNWERTIHVASNEGGHVIVRERVINARAAGAHVHLMFIEDADASELDGLDAHVEFPSVYKALTFLAKWFGG